MDPDAKPQLMVDLFKKQFSDSNLLTQFYIAMERRFSQNRSSYSETDGQAIAAMFNEKQTWSNARRIELRMITVLDDLQIPKYLQRYLFEAKLRFTPEQYAFYQNSADKLATQAPEESRELLLQLVEDLQEASVVRWLKKRFANILAARTNVFFFLTAVIFVFLYTFPWPLAWETAITNLVLSVSAGLLGACFSMLTGMKKKMNSSDLEELRNQTRYVNIMSRITIGGGAALLLFFFAQSGLLGDKILPQFQHEPITEEMLSAKLERSISLHSKLNHETALDPDATQDFIEKCRDWLPNLREQSPNEAQSKIQAWMSDNLAKIWQVNVEPASFQSILNSFSQSMWDLVRKPGFLDNAAKAQMLILCILVGFSEKLVPDLLNRAEKRVRDSFDDPQGPGPVTK